jgi:hypothetical protein
VIRDTRATFALHLRWAALMAIPLVASLSIRSLADPWMYLWTMLALVVCLLPVAIWKLEARSKRRGLPVAQREHAGEPAAAFPDGVEAA